MGDENFDFGDEDQYGGEYAIIAGADDDILEGVEIIPKPAEGPEDELFEIGAGGEEVEAEDNPIQDYIEPQPQTHVMTDVRIGPKVLVPRHASKYERGHLIELMMKRIDAGMVLDQRIITKSRDMYEDEADRVDSLNLATIAINMALDRESNLDLGIYLDRPTLQGFESYELKDLPLDPVRYGTLNLESQMLQHLMRS